MVSVRVLQSVLAIWLSLSFASPLAAQEDLQLKRPGRVYLDDVVVSPEGDRDVELYLRVETLIGEPVDRLTADSIAIRDGTSLVDPASVQLARLSQLGLGTSSVLVLDTSRTMKGDPFDQAKAAALEFLGRMGEFDHVAIVSFADEVRVVSDFGAPRNEARLALEQLDVEAKTLSKKVWDGAIRAVELLRSRPATLPRRGFVIVFSDGRDSSSVSAVQEVIDLAQGRAGQGRTPVFTVGYSRFGGAGLEDLDSLAHGTGAASFQATSADDLPRFFDEIWKRMVGSFVARYPGEMDGQRHAVQVGIGGQTESREADYPEMRRPLWPFAAAGAGFALLLAIFVLARRLRRAGRLIFEGGPQSGREVILESGKLRVGALDENDLVLNLPTVSRFHAQLHVRGGRIEVEDLGSKNGTFINGVQIHARSTLGVGDRLRIGDVQLMYRK